MPPYHLSALISPGLQSKSVIKICLLHSIKSHMHLATIFLSVKRVFKVCIPIWKQKHINLYQGGSDTSLHLMKHGLYQREKVYGSIAIHFHRLQMPVQKLQFRLQSRPPVLAWDWLRWYTFSDGDGRQWQGWGGFSAVLVLSYGTSSYMFPKYVPNTLEVFQAHIYVLSLWFGWDLRGWPCCCLLFECFKM